MLILYLHPIVLNGVEWLNLPTKDLRLGLSSSPFFKLKKRYPDLNLVQVNEDSRCWLTRSDIRCLQEINGTK